MSDAVRVMVAVAVMSTPGPLVAQIDRHVIQISVDGLHGPGLQSLMQSRPVDFQHFRRLFAEGSSTFNARTDFFNTLTLPNHTSMITARPVQQPAGDPTAHHGYLRNSTPAKTDVLHSFNPNVEYIASTFDMAHDHGLSTGLYASKEKFVLFEQTYNTTEGTAGGRPDQYLDDGDHGSDKIDQFVVILQNSMSTALVDQFVVDMAAEPLDYVFLHLTEPDLVGHNEGWRTTAWDDSVALVDQHLGRVFDLVETHPELSGQTTILLTADHGGMGFFHTNPGRPQHYTIPFFAWGADVAPGTDLYNLNTGTRLDPRNGRPPYTDEVQPIRNADSANLAMSLLGLPSVDGSRINTRQNLLVDYWGSAVWDSDSANAGDSASWFDAENWTRNERTQTRPLAGDLIELAVNSETHSIDVGGFQFVHSLTFRGDYRLFNADLNVFSGKLQLDDGVHVTVEGLIRSDNGLVLEGDATLQVDGTSDTMLVRRGLLMGEASINGQVFNDDRVSPGSGIGTMTIDEHFTQSDAGTLIMEIENGDPANPRHDQLTITADLNLYGGLALQPTVQYQDPTVRGDFDLFQLITMKRRVGSRTFRRVDYAGDALDLTVNTPQLQVHHAGDGLFRQLRYSDNDVTFVNYRAVAGDANGDGRFDSQDVVAVFRAGLYEDGDNDNATWTTGDWNGDLDFGSPDLVAAFSSGGYETDSVFELVSVANVPEPMTLTNLFTGLSLIVFFRRRYRRRCSSGSGSR